MLGGDPFSSSLICHLFLPFQVLSETGPSGLTLSDIAYRMQKNGLRDLKTIRHPEASIAQAMSRDAVFVRVAPSTFALQSVITHQRRLLAKQEQRTPMPKEASAGGAPQTEPSSAAKAPDEGAASALTPGAKEAEEEMAEYSDDDDDDEDADAAVGREPQAEPWLQAFLTTDYDSLSLTDRLGALSFLVSLVVNSPTVRAKLDERSEQGARLKRTLLEEVKVCLLMALHLDAWIHNDITAVGCLDV